MVNAAGFYEAPMTTPSPLLLDQVRLRAVGRIYETITLVTLALHELRAAGLSNTSIELEVSIARDSLMALAQDMGHPK